MTEGHSLALRAQALAVMKHRRGLPAPHPSKDIRHNFRHTSTCSDEAPRTLPMPHPNKDAGCGSDGPSVSLAKSMSFKLAKLLVQLKVSKRT